MAVNTINNDMTMGGATGTLLAGRYRVVRQLGQGGMGSVWLAEDTKLDGFRVAIKMLPSVLVNNKRAYAQVKAEALVSLKLSHPNIATVRAFEEENGSPFLVMDYIDGQTLDDYLAEKGKLTEEETIRLLKPVAAALDYAHAQGVVHRDVKPGNVMIRKDGTPFVLDFGIAREIQETMTRVTGKLSSGTLLYMSPEQLRGASPKPAQDVYSFAALAYECLKGEPPFNRGGVEDQIKHKTPEPLSGNIAICPSVMAGLEKKPEARPRTCAAILDKKGTGILGVNRSAAAWLRRVGVLVLAAGLIAGGYLGWQAFQRHEAERRVAIREEIEQRNAKRNLEREAERLGRLADAAQEKSDREKYSSLSGLKEFAEKLEQARTDGRAALGRDDLVAATNQFRAALVCADWLASNAVLRARGIETRVAAESRRAEADKADARNLASNEYARAEKLFAEAEKSFSAVRFGAAAAGWKYSDVAFGEAVRAAEKERKRVADKVAAQTKAFDELRFKEIVDDPESEKVPELRFLAGLVYENGLGGVLPDLNRAVALYGGTTGVCALAEAHLAQMRLSGDYLDKDDSEATTNRIVACLPEIQLRADKGESLAAFALYEIYNGGVGVTKDRQKGKKWLERSVAGGGVFAKWAMAAKLYFGDDIYPMDRKQVADLMLEVEPAQWWVAYWLRGVYRLFEGKSDLSEQDFQRCLPAVKCLSRQGSAEAMCAFGHVYENGWGVPKDAKESFHWYRLAAEKGNDGAQAGLAGMYCKGEGVDKDEKEAVRWARKAARQGNSLGQELLGVFYQKGIGVEKDAEAGFRWLKKSAENGHLEAMELLGDCYRNGIGAATNKSEAVYWYRKGAIKGHAGSSNMLGLMYENGEGCLQDEKEAVKWYQKASDKGHVEAHWNLGLFYLEGRPGVLKDEVRAYELMCKSAKQGMSIAQNMVGWMLEKGKGCHPNVEEAVDWYRRAADQGLVVAQWNLGLCYEAGKGVRKDLKVAYDWILKAAEQGYADAQAQVGWMLEDGRGCEKDLAAARQWYLKAVAQNSALAENNLGVLYMDGKGVAKSDRLAKYWLERAMQHGNAKAPYNLGLMYKDGRCGPVNMQEARRLLKQAEANGDADAKRVLDSIGRWN